MKRQQFAEVAQFFWDRGGDTAGCIAKLQRAAEAARLIAFRVGMSVLTLAPDFY